MFIVHTFMKSGSQSRLSKSRKEDAHALALSMFANGAAVDRVNIENRHREVLAVYRREQVGTFWRIVARKRNVHVGTYRVPA